MTANDPPNTTGNSANKEIVNHSIDNAVATGGAYEILRKRLNEQGNQLATQANNLNDARTTEFGGVDMKVIGRVRVRTENNCIARDIVQVGNMLLFGFNVYIGLKKEVKVEDVFTLFELNNENGEHTLSQVDLAGTFLQDNDFIDDFTDLYRYYKHTKITQLSAKDGKLLAAFQIGERDDDIRVFRWSISAEGTDIKYIDNRGERDILLPSPYDFEWQEATRENIDHGRFPHINILDTVFVETINGTLTIKIENNTNTGLGVYSEEVEDKTQSLDDPKISYSKVGELVLLNILPYKEEHTRYFVYNPLTETATRIDEIDKSCVQLPEEHGIIFPGGYYLQTGEYKTFADITSSHRFKRAIKSPNGEDIIYIFYERKLGEFLLLSYNLITKTLQNPIIGHGYAIFEDGNIIVFSAEDEPTRVHPMQIWQTPYSSRDYVSSKPANQSYLGKIGNAELVRGISNLYALVKLVNYKDVSIKLYEKLNTTAIKLFDIHYWLNDEENKPIGESVKEIVNTSELLLDEFEKVQLIRNQSDKALKDAVRLQSKLLQDVATSNWEMIEDYVAAITDTRSQRGHIATIKEYRYIDLEKLEILDEELVETENKLGRKTVEFLADAKSLLPYENKIGEFNKHINAIEKNAEIKPITEAVDNTIAQLDLISELVSSLKVNDATIKIQIVDTISEIYAKLNQTRASALNKQKSLGSKEAQDQFAAQFRLFSQSAVNALSSADSPEKCDDQLSRLLVQLEELESDFSEYDQFLEDILIKREEVHDAFEAHKQRLVEERQRKAQVIVESADRIMKSVEKRSLSIPDQDKLNTYFASDSLVAKIKQLIEKLNIINQTVAAEDIESKFKALKEQAIRSLRDKSDIFEEGGNVIKLGTKHKFSVNTQDLDLTIIPRKNALYFHLTGTDYFEMVDNKEIESFQDCWAMSIESESDEVYRAEYLAYQVWHSAQLDKEGLSRQLLVSQSTNFEDLTKTVRSFATSRYKQGYQKGIHDNDATKILQSIIPAFEKAQQLRFDPLCRGIAQLFWMRFSCVDSPNDSVNSHYKLWHGRAKSAYTLLSLFADTGAKILLVEEIEDELAKFCNEAALQQTNLTIRNAAYYLADELAEPSFSFTRSKYSKNLLAGFEKTLDSKTWHDLLSALMKISNKPGYQWKLLATWLSAYIEKNEEPYLYHYIPETIAIILSNKVDKKSNLQYRDSDVDLELEVTDLTGNHTSLKSQTLNTSIDKYMRRMLHHHEEVLPRYNSYLKCRHHILAHERNKLRLDAYKARPLSSFVRNKLINDLYLPLIGDNLAKQIGTIGDGKRTDLMGLLMMISPPGYGKTTLMEYVANRLGLIFVKINCPALGHDVISLDPNQAPNATSRQELEKINLAFEMANNVMLYLDDIQHTSPEFLQKYISLCDGTRRIEGVWKETVKTYDMRGKRFCIVMAGNPYTESGEVFKVPDMLANRADIYNLGDILGGMDAQFELSYLENCLTSNPVLAPLALRDMEDVYKLIRISAGENIATTELSHEYSGVEISEITNVVRKLSTIQEIVLKINKQYIYSAAQDNKYRVEPPFRLQGSYRNMNKMAEKVSAVMNEKELEQLINDHYLGEAQLLTTGAEENLLKLAELQNGLSETQKIRWDQIQNDFLRHKEMGGDETETANKIVGQMVNISSAINSLGSVVKEISEKP